MSNAPGPSQNSTLRYRAAMACYQATLGLAMPLVFRYFKRRAAKDPDYGLHLEERRGQGAYERADVWIHAVSLGEFNSALPTIRLLLAAGHRLCLTHATPAGRRASASALAGEIADGRVQVVYAPVDKEGYWRGFFNGVTPRLGLVFEMEFWPGMTEAARRANVPLWFVNSQIPEASFARARRVRRWLGGHPAARGAGVLAKSTVMADRFREIGASNVTSVGETRFDIAPNPAHLEAGQSLKETLGTRPVFTFASVVEGEEKTYLAAVRKFASHPERPFVIWVPRAPELFDATAARLEAAGIATLRRSVSFDDRFNFEGDLDSATVLVGDSFGEMFFYLSAADAVSVGGGFVEKGAHNVIEPLALGKPVVTGPHIWTVEFPGREAIAAGVMQVCENSEDLSDILMASLDQDASRAQAFHSSHLGASRRIADMAIERLGASK